MPLTTNRPIPDHATRAKPTVPEVLPLVQAWYARPGHEAGGLFHTILDDGNAQQHWADAALVAARASGEADALHLAGLLVAMSPTQRLKLSRSPKA